MDISEAPVAEGVSAGRGWSFDMNLLTAAETLDERSEERCSFGGSRSARSPRCEHEPGAVSSGGEGKSRGSSMVVGEKDVSTEGRLFVAWALRLGTI
jgi:hypothetical protein